PITWELMTKSGELIHELKSSVTDSYTIPRADLLGRDELFKEPFTLKAQYNSETIEVYLQCDLGDEGEKDEDKDKDKEGEGDGGESDGGISSPIAMNDQPAEEYI